MTVGIDGGFVRAAHKEGWFEVIGGKSVVAFCREENDETPSAKCFGFFRLTIEAASPSVGVAEVARNAREPADSFPFR